MTRVGDVAVALLAAGRGRRFGSDKLLAPIEGIPMGLHIAQTLEKYDFAARFAVCATDSPLKETFARLGFQSLINRDPTRGQASSLQIAVRAAEHTSAQALLIVLADMPFVTAAHILSIIDAGGLAASHDGNAAMPPALFPRAYWPALIDAEGDQGGRTLLSGARLVHAPPSELRDVDVAADLPTPPQS